MSDGQRNAIWRHAMGLRTPGSTLMMIAASLVGSDPAVASQDGTCGEYYRIAARQGTGHNLFGHSVGVSGTIVVVGAPFARTPGLETGSAYVFDTLSGEQVFQLDPDDLSEYDWFGHDVAVDGTLVAIGSPGDDDNGPESGSVYLYDATTGGQLAKLLPDDGRSGAYFGTAVAISGSLVAVGVPHDDDNGMDSGAVYVFDADTHSLITKLKPRDGAPATRFGESVAISGDTVIAGAPAHDFNGSRSGAAYLFDAMTGDEIARLLPGDGASADAFGISVALSGSFVVVGAFGDDDNGNGAGCAYVFDARTGKEIRKLLPADGSTGDAFGISAAIDSSITVIGAWKDADNGNYAGSAYLFDIATGSQTSKLSPRDSDSGDQFGWRVGISNKTVVVGMRDDFDDNTRGSAFLFDARACHPCPPDWNEDGDVTTDDVLAFITSWAASDPEADRNHDGLIDTRDVIAFLAAWAAGC
ncbi:MAG: FG-GAP repeat protein [Phycisphaerales bacterium]|nr:FG-GAP repeat protein [Phycisphaerales bacterium]